MRKFEGAGELNCRKIRGLIDEHLGQVSALDALKPVVPRGSPESPAISILQQTAGVAQHHEDQNVSFVGRDASASDELLCGRSEVFALSDHLPSEARIDTRNSQHERSRSTDELLQSGPRDEAFADDSQ